MTDRNLVDRRWINVAFEKGSGIQGISGRNPKASKTVLFQPLDFSNTEMFLGNNQSYIDLARDKSEALDNIYSLFRHNIKSFNAKRRTVKNNNRSNKQKSNFVRAAHFFCTFLCCCFARLQRETFRNFLITRFMQEMSYVFLITFFSSSLIFTLVAASISHFLTAATEFRVVPLTKMSQIKSNQIFIM